MKIAGFKIYSIGIPMRFGVSHSLAERNVTSNIIVCAVAENGIKGYGECCPRPYVTGETIHSVVEEMTEIILPSMLGKMFSDFGELTDFLSSASKHLNKNQLAAFCAAELALLDLAGITFEKSAADIIGPPLISKIRYSGVIATPYPQKAAKFARAMRRYGLRDIKVKVGTSIDENLNLLKNVTENLPDSITLRVDANCAWTAEQALNQLEMMRKFNIVAVEQPVPADDLEAMARVTSAKLAHVIADESLCSISDAEKLIDRKACDIFNVRVSKCGGMINSAAICRKAARANLVCQLGAQVGETSILSAAGRHIAARCNQIKWCEGSYGYFLLKGDIIRPSITIGPGGWTKKITKHGLGVIPKEKLINKYKLTMTEM